jgi:hypothetical protein
LNSERIQVILCCFSTTAMNLLDQQQQVKVRKKSPSNRKQSIQWLIFFIFTNLGAHSTINISRCYLRSSGWKGMSVAAIYYLLLIYFYCIIVVLMEKIERVVHADLTAYQFISTGLSMGLLPPMYSHNIVIYKNRIEHWPYIMCLIVMFTQNLSNCSWMHVHRVKHHFSMLYSCIFFINAHQINTFSFGGEINLLRSELASSFKSIIYVECYLTRIGQIKENKIVGFGSITYWKRLPHPKWYEHIQVLKSHSSFSSVFVFRVLDLRYVSFSRTKKWPIALWSWNIWMRYLLRILNWTKHVLQLKRYFINWFLTQPQNQLTASSQ